MSKVLRPSHVGGVSESFCVSMCLDFLTFNEINC